MAMTSAQLIARACTIAKAPGYTVQAGQYLNMVLATLCQTYDFDYIATTTSINFVGGTPTYLLPADHLRTREVFYNINGSVFYLDQIDIRDEHKFFTGVGVNNYPEQYATDVSTTPHTLVPYPPPNIAVPVTVIYFPQKADIVTPETSSAVPWFINQEYLITRTAAYLMSETEDTRQESLERMATNLLEKILIMSDDKEGFAQTMKLSRTHFKPRGRLGPDKTVPLG